MSRELVGKIGIDSGQFFIIDPAFLEQWQPGGYDDDGDQRSSYARITEYMLHNTFGEVERGFVFGCVDDFEYPVYVVWHASGRLQAIEIEGEKCGFSMNHEIAGWVNVVSGQLFVTDPGIMSDWEPRIMNIDQQIEAKSRVTVTMGAVLLQNIPNGRYPVFVTDSNARSKVEIMLDETLEAVEHAQREEPIYQSDVVSVDSDSTTIQEE